MSAKTEAPPMVAVWIVEVAGRSGWGRIGLYARRDMAAHVTKVIESVTGMPTRTQRVLVSTARPGELTKVEPTAPFEVRDLGEFIPPDEDDELEAIDIDARDHKRYGPDGGA